MFHEVIELNKHFDLTYNSTLEYCSLDSRDTAIPTKPALIICPGGGYEFVSKREGDPIAAAFLLKGFNTFVLTYTVDREHRKSLFPTPQLEALAAIAYVRRNATKYHVDPNRIALIGFSAGGHLAAYAATMENNPELLKKIGVSKEEAKVNCLALGYPVIDFEYNTHQGTALACTNGDPKLMHDCSVNNLVTKDYPPTFIWSTWGDRCVPIHNSQVMEKACRDAGVPVMLRIHATGDHGQSLSIPETGYGGGEYYKEVASWVDELEVFFMKHLDLYRE